MVQPLKELIPMERRKDLVCMYGKINLHILEIGNLIVWREKVSSLGQMVANIKVNGLPINYIIMVSFHGQMVVYIEDNG